MVLKKRRTFTIGLRRLNGLDCLPFSHYRAGHWIDFKSKTRLDCRIICANSTCVWFICYFNDANSPRAFRIKNESKDDRNPSVCQTILVNSMLLHYISFGFCHILYKCWSWRIKLVQELRTSCVQGLHHQPMKMFHSI